MRANTSPVTGAPFGPRATGSCRNCMPFTLAVGRTAVAPALSPCHALANMMSPNARSCGANANTRPRLGTSCHISPLAFDASTGFRITNDAT
jgi:hypothetical protein